MENTYFINISLDAIDDFVEVVLDTIKIISQILRCKN